jgi:hypothetical protein
MSGFNLHNGLKALIGCVTSTTATAAIATAIVTRATAAIEAAIANSGGLIGFGGIKRTNGRYNSTCLMLILSAVSLSGCYQATSVQNEGFEPLPPNTPFIMGHLEAATDTMVNYPEILVGTVNSIPIVEDFMPIPDLYPLHKPTLIETIEMFIEAFYLDYSPDGGAKVVIKGPLSTSDYREVIFTHTENGIFKDLNNELLIKASGSYELSVELSDGRIFGTQTTIPDPVDAELPNEYVIHTELGHYHSGEVYEVGIHELESPIYYPPKGSFLGEEQINSSFDDLRLHVPSIESLDYYYSGNHTRSGFIFAFIKDMRKARTLRFPYFADIIDRERIVNEGEIYHRLAFHNEDVGPLHDFVGQFLVAFDTLAENYMIDSMDLLNLNNYRLIASLSNIQFKGVSRESAPKDTLVVGHFSGSSAWYHTTKFTVERSFNVDSVLQDLGF